MDGRTTTETPSLSPLSRSAATQTLPEPTFQAVQTLESYRSSCPDLVTREDVSTSGDWISIVCEYSLDDGSYIALYVHHPASQIEWKIAYRQGSFPWNSEEHSSETGLKPIRWSTGEEYLYFSLYSRGDGPRGYFQSGESLQRLDLRTGNVSQVLSASPVPGHFYTFDFSPTGRQLAYTISKSPYTIYLVDMVFGDEMTISVEGDWSILGRFNWSPDGQWLAFVTGTFSDFHDGMYSLGVISPDTLNYQMILTDIVSPLVNNRWEAGKLVSSWEERGQTTNELIEHTLWFDPLTGETTSTETPKQ